MLPGGRPCRVPGGLSRPPLHGLQEQQDPLSHFHMDTLLMTTHNLLFGGTETVSTTLRHTFLVLMKYPKVQGVPPGIPPWAVCPGLGAAPTMPLPRPPGSLCTCQPLPLTLR